MPLGGKAVAGQTDVVVRGTAALVAREENFLSLQQGEAGLGVVLTNWSVVVQVGDVVDVTGRVELEQGMPVFKAHSAVVGGKSDVSVSPRDVDVGTLAKGGLGGNLVQVHGVVWSASRRQQEVLLELGDRGISVAVVLPMGVPTETKLARWIDAELVVRGVLRPGGGGKPELVGAGFPDVVLLGSGEPVDGDVLRIAGLLRTKEPTNHRVRVMGRVVQRTSGQDVLLDDFTGQVGVRTRGRNYLRVGEWADVAGFLERDGERLWLGYGATMAVAPRMGTYTQEEEKARKPANPKDFSRVLTQARAVRTLSPQAAGQGLPARIRGVVTYADLEYQHMVVQDATEGIYAAQSAGRMAVRAGQMVEVTGFTAPGLYAPILTEAISEYLEDVDMPAPRRAVIDELLTGRFDSQFVEISAVIQGVDREGAHLFLDLVSAGRNFAATLPDSPRIEGEESWVDSEVLLRGVCSGDFNEKRQLTQVRLLLPNPEAIQVVSPSPRDPYQLPVKSISSLLTFSFDAEVARRAQVRGQVIAVHPEFGVCVEDESDSIWVHPAKGTQPKTGDLVRVVGFPAAQRGRPELDKGEFRIEGGAPLPDARLVEASREVPEKREGRRVRVQGVVLDRAVRNQECALQIRGEQGTFEALVPCTTGPGIETVWPAGAEVAVEGVVRVQRDSVGAYRGWSIVCGAPQSVIVLRRPSWFTGERARLILGFLALLAVLASAWGVTLRRRVARQTALIRERALRESALAGQYRLVWDKAMDGLRITDDQGKITRVNEAYSRLVGLPRESLEGQPLTVAYLESTRRDILKGYLEKFQARTIEPYTELELQFHDGRRVWLAASHGIFEQGDGQRFVLSSFRDVTDARRDEARRIAIERRLVEAQRVESLGVLAGGLAHEFNNLLTAIMGNCGLASMELGPVSPQHRYLGNIEKASQRAAELCRQMLVCSGQSAMMLGPLNLNSLVNELRELLAITVGQGIRVEIVTGGLDGVVRADGAQIKQLLLALVKNAAEAMRDKTGWIRIRTGTLHVDAQYLANTQLLPEIAEGRYCFLEVADNGHGMAADVQSRAFDPFFSTRFTGRGLGLAAVLGIARGHHGGIHLRSRLGEGTVFTVLLPFANATPDLAHPKNGGAGAKPAVLVGEA